MSALPEHVETYVGKLMSAAYPAYLQVDQQTHVVQFGGALEYYGIDTINIDTPASEHIAALEGVISAPRPLVLPYVQLSESHYADVHLFDEGEHTWVVFVDTSTEGAEQQQFQQRYLSRTLAHEQYNNLTPNNDLIAWRILSQLEMATFERQANDGFRLIGEMPAWLQFIDCDAIADGWCWPDQHPFMHAFISSLEKQWSDKFQRPIRSPIWTESTANGELYLQLIALTTHQQQVLILERLSRARAERTRNAQTSNSYQLFQESMQKFG